MAKCRNRLGCTIVRPERVRVVLLQLDSGVDSVGSPSRQGVVKVVLDPGSKVDLDVAGNTPSVEGVSPSEGNESPSEGSVYPSEGGTS